MLILTTAIKALQQLIIHAQPEQTRLSVELQPLHSTELIEWFDAQILFPQFYWQSRDGDEEVVALGKCRHFNNINAAKGQFSEPQRIWGGCDFSHQEYYFLPQIELTRNHNSWQLSVNLPADSVLLHEDAGSKNTAQAYDKKVLLESLANLITPAPTPIPLSYKIEARSHYPEFNQWSHLVTKALSAIKQQRFAKVVLARQSILTLNRPLSAAQFLQKSRQVNQYCFHFIFALKPNDYFVGSTPERLFTRTRTQLHTEALAGTAARSDDAVEDRALANWLLHDPKNCYENRLVVDDLMSRLGTRCASLQVSMRPELVKLRKVQHLKHHISGELAAGVDDAELLASLQPTAAIAGLPRQPALDFIAENEPFARGWYSGALGYVGQQQSEFCVAIRSARILENELQLFAGAGIVPGSDPMSEWQELERKTATLLTLLEPDSHEHSDINDHHDRKQEHALANLFTSEQQRA